MTTMLVTPDGSIPTPLAHEPVVHGWDDLRWIAMTDRRDAIRIYARLGLHPILVNGLRGGRCTCDKYPCGDENRSAGKHPVLFRWQKAPLDLDTMDSMLQSNWGLNVGLRTGVQPCGRFLLVIDVDGPRSLLDPLEAEHGECPPTLTARTGRGGLHLFYWARPGVDVPNRAGIVPGVDVRGSGGQVVAPPSAHRSGNRYEWINIREPEVLP